MTVGVSGMEAHPPCPLLGPLGISGWFGKGWGKRVELPLRQAAVLYPLAGEICVGGHLSLVILAFPATVPELAFAGVGMDQEYLVTASLACSCWSWWIFILEWKRREERFRFPETFDPTETQSTAQQILAAICKTPQCLSDVSVSPGRKQSAG